ncbi:glycosyltransferase family 2 protein [Aquabacterium sp. A7-Y]|uniref:glycosyltransferase family 2 protein n=1 Tax=Aquabacterium sp. A7-Y TaxID=1349605 RepID=UPI00223D6138|nr:glycosyltransferase family 2 protein [Aquabacterium sp. A7-Y]MCW7537514.1 glycosyltransferase family 2 protein [Aquabacterium sp. A7-Y]
MMILPALVLACLGAVLYSYLVYPLVLFVLGAAVQGRRDAARVFRKTERRATLKQGELPRVAIVISAFNEERHIGERIANLLALDYPADRWCGYIGSDGSRDATGSILSACDDSRIRAFVFEQNRGKANVLNDLVSRTQEELIVFSDANTFFEPGALRRLVAPFQDPGVGGVSGELRLAGSAGDNQDSLYWRIEQFLKFFEARIGGLLGANGAIYAIRRAAWKPLRPDTICDDFCVAMNVAAAGQRLVYEPSAWAEEATPDAIGEEYRRRVRIGIGNFQALCRHPEYLLRTSPGTAFAYLSHKVLRWIAPHLLLLALLGSAWLGLDSMAWRVFALLQLLGYLGAAGLFAASVKGLRLPGLLRLPAFLFALNWAFLVASLRYASGRYSGSWRRSSR